MAFSEASSSVGGLSFGQPLANPAMMASRIFGSAASSFARIGPSESAGRPARVMLGDAR